MAGCGSSGGERAAADGPLRAGLHDWTLGAALVPGRPVSTGFFQVAFARGADRGPATLERVRLASASPQVQLVGAVVAGTDRPIGGFVSDRRWPPPRRIVGATQPLAGYRIRPTPAVDRLGVLIVLGLRADTLGRARVRSVRLDYRQGDRRYSEVMPMRYDLTVARRYP
jgi:hypothetical protein